MAGVLQTASGLSPGFLPTLTSLPGHPAEASPRHHAATTMLHGEYGMFTIMCSVYTEHGA